MLITYPSPLLRPASGVSVSATQVTTLAGAVDGRSGGLTRLAWGGSEGFPVATETVTASFPVGVAVVPRVAALVNLEGLPAGLAVDVSLKTVGGGYDYETQSLQTFTTPSGDIAVVAVWPAGLNFCDGVRFSIANTGAAVEFDQEFSLGEIVLAGAADLDLDPNWADGLTDLAGSNFSKNGQLYLQPVPAGRSISLQISPVLFEEATLDEESVLALRMALANDPRCMVIADPSTQERIQKTSIYGSAVRLDELRFDSASRRAVARFQFNEMVGRAV